MLLGNYSVRNLTPGKEMGASTNPSGWMRESSLRGVYIGDANVTNVSNRAALPNGYGSDAWLMPPKAGGVSSSNARGTGTATAAGINGKFTSGQADGVGTATASLSLIVQAIGSAGGTCTVTGTIGGSLSAEGTAAGSATALAYMSALMKAVGQADGVGSATATLRGNGSVSGTIYVNESQATVEQIADAVVQAIVDMGATGGLTAEEHAQLMKTLTTGKFLGLK
jgi:hypothetical protein